MYINTRLYEHKTETATEKIHYLDKLHAEDMHIQDEAEVREAAADVTFL